MTRILDWRRPRSDGFDAMTEWIDWNGFDARITAGRRIFIPGSSGEPIAFLEALQARPDMLLGSEIVTSFIAGLNAFDFAAIDPTVRVTSFFPLRSAATDAAARTRFVPISYFEILGFLQHCDLDVAIVQVSPPDAGGRCSLGPCVEFSPVAVAAAKCRIALVNAAIRPGGHQPSMAFSDFDFAIHAEAPLREIPTPRADAVSVRIAAHVATLVDDGATIQTGIGKIPGQVLAALSARRGLRIHSGIVLPGARDLVEQGAIDGAGAIVAASGAGDAKFYRWLADSPEVRLAEIGETHGLARLVATPRLTAINSAIEVDLLGQCNAEMIGGRYISGAGGLPEFTTGAHRSPGGRSIIALPATDKDGSVTRIVAHFRPGTPVAVPRQAVDFVVTEYGVADLREKTAAARADALIAIAAPQFHAELDDARGR